MESVRDNSETSVRACNAAGKSGCAARIALWFLFNHPQSIVITTAPTDRQVKGILWKEIGVAHARAKYDLGGECITQELKIERDWYAWGFTAPDYDPERFQGFHAPYILVIVDEASGVSQDIQEAIDGILASGHARKLEIGNPVDPVSVFAKSFKTPGISKIKISAFDTPNFTELGITREDIDSGAWEQKAAGGLPMPWLVTPAWVSKLVRRNGWDAPHVQSRILADFPATSDDTLIPLAWIEAAQQRNLERTAPHVLGLDPGAGGDPSMIYERWGPVVRFRQEINEADTMVVTGHAARALSDSKADRLQGDVIGIGAGVLHRGRELGLPFIDANASTKATNPERYANARAEWFWNLRERAAPDRGELDLDPADEELAEELAAIKWKPDSSGRTQIEKKEAIKKRIGRSTNRADAVAIAFANVPMLSYDYTSVTKREVAAPVKRAGFRSRSGGML